MAEAKFHEEKLKLQQQHDVAVQKVVKFFLIYTVHYLKLKLTLPTTFDKLLYIQFQF